MPDPATQPYYLCASLPGVAVYVSSDLDEWQGPRIAFEVPEGLGAQASV